MDRRERPVDRGLMFGTTPIAQNVDMMAENTNVKVKVMNRQSLDTSANFSSEDSRFKCWCHEIFDPNRSPEKCSPGLDETVWENVHRVVSAKNKLLNVFETHSGAPGPIIKSYNKSGPDANQSKY
ncbi:hypothetical protein cypCar_00007369 [Cyprinus carpio]|nr:hypothetical protein cypCar_00007369 [Cyprinus carpio]